ncbi:MAG: hypothetical protein ACTSRG_06255 [Candidatus Helarchaeota archaeon]
MSKKVIKPKKKAKSKSVISKVPTIEDFKLNKIRQIAKKIEHKEIKLPKGTLIVDDADRNEARKRLVNVAKELFHQIRENGKPVFSIPSRNRKNIIYDEESDLLLLGKEVKKRPFHSLTSVSDATRLIAIMNTVNEILEKDKHMTKREVYYTNVELFLKDQKNSDKNIEDLATLLRTIRNSTHIVAGTKGIAIGKLKIRDSGDVIDLERLGTGGWGISPFLDKVEIVESDAEFILVVEKEAALIRLTEEKFWRDYPCIILTAKGQPDVATRMFLRRLSKELGLPVFSLVDSDPYGHYIHSVYLRGSKKLSYESPFLATPGIKLLGVLSQDLDIYGIPDSCKIQMTDADISRIDDMLKENFVRKNARWVQDLENMKKTNTKAEIQSLSAKGIEYLTDSYIPTKLSTGDWI